MQAEVANALKAFGQDVLDHAADETQHGQGGVLDGVGLVILVPVADLLAVVLLDAANRDRRRDDVLGQIFSQSLSAGGHVSRLQMSHEAFGVVFPAAVDVFLDCWIAHLLAE